MRVFKITSALIAVLAFSAIGVATASAAETAWLSLPGAAKTSLTGKSGKATLQVKGGASITCVSSSTTGELTGQTTGTGTITFKECTTAGLTVLNEGSTEKGIITAKVKLANCVIKASDAGVKFTVEELKLLVPSVSQKLTIKGSLITLISPNKSSKTGPFPLTVEQKEGVQAISACEGGTAQTLETSTNGGAFVQSGQEAKEGTVTYSVAQEIMV